MSSVEPVPFARLRPGPTLPPSEVAADQRDRIHRAVLEIVAEQGYAGFKVRDVAQLAGVSTRSFYQHFESKEECFVYSYGKIAREARVGLISAQMDGSDWRERSRLVLRTFAETAEREPAAVHVGLLDVYTDGSSALAEAYKTEDNFIAMVAKSLGREPGGIRVPQLVVEGLMAGIARVACARIRAGVPEGLRAIEEPLLNWVHSFLAEEAPELAELDTGRVRGNAALLEMRERERAIPARGDTRAAILTALARLCGAEDYSYEGLTIPVVRAAAGVSRKTFDSHFDGVEECFLAALDLRMASTIADMSTEQMAGSSWEGGVYRAISSLCNEIAGDPLLARACIRDDFPPGSKGSQVRRNLIAGIVDQIRASTGVGHQASDLVAEASGGAIWALFHHHVLRNWAPHRPEIAATLAYMALAPLVGAANAVEAIRREQVSVP